MDLHRSVFLREAAVATAVVVVLYGLAHGVQFAPFQIPGYLIIVGFDALESVFGAVGRGYPVVFGAYLIGLGLIGATVAHLLRDRLDGEPWWRLAAAGAFGVVGALSLLFCGFILVGTTQGEPVLITGVTGVAFLAAAAWLAGYFDPESRAASS